jgi:hypothetical protein
LRFPEYYAIYSDRFNRLMKENEVFFYNVMKRALTQRREKVAGASTNPQN